MALLRYNSYHSTFTVYIWMVFSRFTGVCKHHRYLILEQEETLCPLAQDSSSLQPVATINLIYLYGFSCCGCFMYVEPWNLWSFMSFTWYHVFKVHPCCSMCLYSTPHTLTVPLDIYPRKVKIYVYTKTCPWIFSAALFIRAPRVETTPVFEGWMDKIYLIKYYLQMKSMKYWYMQQHG